MHGGNSQRDELNPQAKGSRGWQWWCWWLKQESETKSHPPIPKKRERGKVIVILRKAAARLRGEMSSKRGEGHERKVEKWITSKQPDAESVWVYSLYGCVCIFLSIKVSGASYFFIAAGDVRTSSAFLFFFTRRLRVEFITSFSRLRVCLEAIQFKEQAEYVHLCCLSELDLYHTLVHRIRYREKYNVRRIWTDTHYYLHKCL